MKTIGLIGGIACGKTTISNMLRNLGAAVIHADPIVHEVLRVPEIIDQMDLRWSKRFGFHYQWERRHIAEIVFSHPEELQFLEDITGPLVVSRILEKAAVYHPKWTPALILDVPLLLEMGLEKHCDLVWYIDMPREHRLENFVRRYNAANLYQERDVLEADFNAREARQFSRERKIEASNAVINNPYGEMKKTEDQLQLLWETQVCPPT